MRFQKRFSGAALAGAALIVSTFAGGCTSKITEQQLQQIRDLRAQERQLSQDISKAQTDRASLDREIASRQSDVRKCNDDKTFVQQQLSKWPNVWPDYTEPAPPPAPSTTTGKKKK